MSTSEFIYDLVTYPTVMNPDIYPDRLAAIGKLYGLDPVPPRTARVLELGCGDGLGLMAYALRFPEAECVGVDLSGLMIQAGKEAVEALKLTNLTLHHASISEWKSDGGTFDYIIAHGVLSWVPEEVRAAMWKLAQECLGPNGLVMFSFNTNPGFYLSEMLRGMFQYHLEKVTDPVKKIQEGMTLMNAIHQAELGNSAYKEIIRLEWERFKNRPMEVFLHDKLAECNRPFWISEFARIAGDHGLRYVGATDFESYSVSQRVPYTVGVNKPAKDPREIRLEQYGDFFTGRRFREAVLCRSSQPISTSPKFKALKDLYLSFPMSGMEFQDEEKRMVRFKGRKNSAILTDHPWAKAALSILGQAWPASIHASDLVGLVKKELGEKPEFLEEDTTRPEWRELAQTLGKGLVPNLLEVHSSNMEIALYPGERPLANPLARRQACSSAQVTTLRMETVVVQDPLIRYLVTLLDGQRTQEQILEELLVFVQLDANRAVKEALDKGKGAEDMKAFLRGGLEKGLERLYHLALMQG